jgi:hypothetical protein
LTGKCSHADSAVYNNHFLSDWVHIVQSGIAGAHVLAEAE